MWPQVVKKLHEEQPALRVPALCELLGVSKQAYYQHKSRDYMSHAQSDVILQLVCDTRKEMPRLGVRKLYCKLLSELPKDIKIGRDALFDLLRDHGMLLRRRSGFVPRTTNSCHRFHTYKNLVKDFVPKGPNELWVSDITYVRTVDNRFYYLSLITDVYSHKIVGWYLLDTLDTEGPLGALKMALKDLPEGSKLIHHSDRGTQYCCGEYVDMLKKNGITISMTESGNPRDNAVAERSNGILKMEWLYDMLFTTLDMSRQSISAVIQTYNTKRPHSSIGMCTPEDIHQNPRPTERLWKNYYKNRKEDAAVMNQNV
jgi:transposase InsO family protein